MPAGVFSGSARATMLFESLEGGRVRCLACSHHCSIAEGECGVCGVRQNCGGQLMAPWGSISGAAADPIEKKPFYHVLPGSLAYSFGTAGCNLHCSFCQNWHISRMPLEATSGLTPATPQQLTEAALSRGAQSMVSTYNEPAIAMEWAAAVFDHARQAGLLTGIVSNGYFSREGAGFLAPFLDFCKIDLKSFRDARYRELGGRLQPVLDSIARMHAAGVWLEVVTLVIPGFNDSDEELGEIAAFLASISRDIPWHVTAFHPDYRMLDRAATPAASLERAVRIGAGRGLHFVYAGNLADSGDLAWTRCAHCAASLVRRRAFRLELNRVGEVGVCPQCAAPVPGIWNRKRKTT